MTDEKYEEKMAQFRNTPLFEQLMARFDVFCRVKRTKWKEGDLAVAGGILLARSQGHDEVREFLTTGNPPSNQEEPVSDYKEPEI